MSESAASCFIEVMRYISERAPTGKCHGYNLSYTMSHAVCDIIL